MRAPHEGGPTGAPRGRRRPTHRGRSREQRVELLKALVEGGQLVASLDEQILAELVTPEHLEHQAPEVTETLLANAEKRPSLPAELAGVGERPARRPGWTRARHSPLAGAAEACEQRRPRHAAQSNSGL
jgi:hypothetical protein